MRNHQLGQHWGNHNLDPSTDYYGSYFLWRRMEYAPS